MDATCEKARFLSNQKGYFFPLALVTANVGQFLLICLRETGELLKRMCSLFSYLTVFFINLTTLSDSLA